jgi:hypothetical protein
MKWSGFFLKYVLDRFYPELYKLADPRTNKVRKYADWNRLASYFSSSVGCGCEGLCPEPAAQGTAIVQSTKKPANGISRCVCSVHTAVFK